MPEFVEVSDFLCKSTTLRRHGFTRAFFDPNNPEHLASLKHYMEKGSWTQQFFVEDPFTDVPMTVFRKYIGHQLGISVTTSEKMDVILARAAELYEITQKRA